MNNFAIDIQLVDGKQAVADTTVDYVPFGVKTLKLQIRKVSGPDEKVWIRTKYFARDADPCAIYGYADDDTDLWAVWGAGDIMGLCVKYAEQAGTKKAVALDANELHTVYLHLIHRPRDPLQHQLRDYHITIVAVTSDAPADLAQQGCDERQYQDTIIAEKTFALTVPDGVTDPTRFVWNWQKDASQIVLMGSEMPRYTSRWWPARQMAYARVQDSPRINLEYVRVANADREGTISIWLENADGRHCLAEVAGHLTIPLYDLRWIIPELYRFYDDKLYVLRLWFFWVDEHISTDDLLAFVPETEQSTLRSQREKEAADLMKPKLLGLWPSWDKQYEIPDIERFDIVFDPENLTSKYGCTDAHWREFWFSVGQGQPCQCRIAAPQDALKVVLQFFARHFATEGEPQPITNPLEEGGVVSFITHNRCHYNKKTHQIVCVAEESQAKAPGMLGKNAPRVENGRLLPNGLSSDVLEG